MSIEYAWTHGAICTGLLGLSFLLLRTALWWYLAAWLYLANIGLLAVYFAVHQMTGAGFNEAALYYLISASWRDVLLIAEYDGILIWGALLIVLAFLFTKVIKRIRPLAPWCMSSVTQCLLVLSTGGFGLYTTPLLADVNFALQSSGINKKDHIGLSAVLRAADPPEILPRPHKNLIVLYVESLEEAFFDEKLFPGLLAKLNQLSTLGVRFNRIEQNGLSGWTIAGMIATQCGIPLSSYRLHNEPHKFEKFSKGYACLSDHLDPQIYKTVYMGGLMGVSQEKRISTKTRGSTKYWDLRSLLSRIRPDLNGVFMMMNYCLLSKKK